MIVGAKYFGFFTLIFLTVIILQQSSNTEACSCMPEHPQSHYCNADYVVIVRVLRKSRRLINENVAYKVEVKKSYKMNSEGHKMLKHGRIFTPKWDSMCGVDLKLGKLYMIAGRGSIINVCNYVKEYMQMSIVERRGFAGVYNKGCKCQIKPCFNNRCFVQSFETNKCMWSPFDKCETDYSACMPTSWRTSEGVIAKCDWRRTAEYKECKIDP